VDYRVLPCLCVAANPRRNKDRIERNQVRSSRRCQWILWAQSTASDFGEVCEHNEDTDLGTSTIRTDELLHLGAIFVDENRPHQNQPKLCDS
jgi:hypothetical protein